MREFAVWWTFSRPWPAGASGAARRGNSGCWSPARQPAALSSGTAGVAVDPRFAECCQRAQFRPDTAPGRVRVALRRNCSADAETAPQGAVGVKVARCNETGCPVARAEGIAVGRRLFHCGTSGFSDLELISRELTGPMFNC